MIKKINIQQFPCLTTAEAQSRLLKDGYNELPTARKRNLVGMIFEVLAEPMILLLVVGGALYFVLGSKHESLMLFSFVFVVIGITLYQENKSERALYALRNLASPRALVIRDGVEVRIAGREVVVGDILILREGDCVPADAILLESENLTVDESLLTGESLPVTKVSEQIVGVIADNTHPGGDDLPFVYSGTLVVQGYGFARVTEVGVATQIGKIGKALKSIEHEKTKLQKETGRLVRNIAVIGLFLCFVVGIFYSITRADWLHGLLAGITLAMAILPEEFPVVLTTFLAIGAWRISQQRVLTRRVPAIEALGSATVLCVDKTGTLTYNKMAVHSLYANQALYEVSELGDDIGSLPENFHELTEMGILASQRDPFDPMEKAIKEFGEHYLHDTEHLHGDWSLVKQYPLSRELLSMSHVWHSPNGMDYTIAAKGAAEAIFDLCHMDAAQIVQWQEVIKLLASKRLRILGVAKAVFHVGDLPDGQHDFQFEFLGLIGLADPVRPMVKTAIESCYAAGIRVIMLTGDCQETALNIAQQIGLQTKSGAITGSQLTAMTDSELRHRIKTTNVFARIMPEQKLRLVNALQANGEIVAMTGDGVNDAPALTKAHIGVAMGERGTDVAREASSLVLLDDDFSAIVAAIKLGRRIFDNIRKAIAYILAVHVPIAGMSLLPVLFQWPLIFFPVHIVFLELIIDPACTIAFESEPEEPDIMQCPPRSPRESLFSKKLVGISLLQGLVVLLVVFAVCVFARHAGKSEEVVRAMTFTTMVIANIGLIFINRSWRSSILRLLLVPNLALWIVTFSALFVLALVLTVPFCQNLFHFAPLNLTDVAISVVAGVVSIAWFEFFKRKSKCVA